jgi:hypothetical protein
MRTLLNSSLFHRALDKGISRGKRTFHRKRAALEMTLGKGRVWREQGEFGSSHYSSFYVRDRDTIIVSCRDLIFLWSGLHLTERLTILILCAKKCRMLNVE